MDPQSLDRRHSHDLARLDEAGHLPEALAAKDVADAVAVRKAAFFAEKDSAGNRIDYMQAVHGDLTLVPTTSAFDALKRDYQRMIEDGLLFGEAESFETLMSKCTAIEAREGQSNQVVRTSFFCRLSIEYIGDERIPIFTLPSNPYLCAERIREVRKVIGRGA
jgi:hypothetical protein